MTTTKHEIIPMAGTNDQLVRITDEDGAQLTIKVAADGHRSVWSHCLHFDGQRDALDWFTSIAWVAEPRAA